MDPEVIASELARLEVPLGHYKGLYHGLRVVGREIKYVKSELPSAEGFKHRGRYCVVDGAYDEPRALCVVRVGAQLVQLEVDLRTRAIVEVARKYVIGDESIQRPRAIVWDYDNAGSDAIAPFNRLLEAGWSAEELARGDNAITVIENRMVAMMRGTQLMISTEGIIRRSHPDRNETFLKIVGNWRNVDSCGAALSPVFEAVDYVCHQRTVCYRNYITRQSLTYNFDTLKLITGWAPF